MTRKLGSTIFIHLLASVPYILSTQAGNGVTPLNGFPGEAINDLEIWKTEQDGDEDVVYLRSRAPGDDDCPTDCASWPLWKLSEENEKELQDLPAEPEDGPTKRDFLDLSAFLGLHRRANTGKASNSAKKAELCKYTDHAGKKQEIKFKAFNYPNPVKAEKESLEVWDFEDPLKPDEKAFWNLKMIGKMHVGQDHNGKEREYGTEHILEWHLLKDFFEHDLPPATPTPASASASASASATPTPASAPIQTDPKKFTRCQILRTFFETSVNIDFDWEYTDGGAKKTKKYKNKEKAHLWLTHQFPGHKTSASPFNSEFTLLQKGINGRKLLLWKHKDQGMVGAPTLLKDGTISETNADNSYTLDLMIQNKYAEGGASKKWDENEGRLATLGVFRDIYGVYKYHQASSVHKTLEAQIKRIGAALEYLEKEHFAKATTFFKDPATNKDVKFKNDAKYEEYGLKKQWEDFIKQRHADSGKKIEDWLKKWNDEFKKQYDAIKKREVEERATDPKGLSGYCGKEKDDTVVKKRIKLLLDAYKNKGDWPKLNI